MKEKRKLYIAPTAELLLLAPSEALASPGTSQDDNIAMNQWGQQVVTPASITGSNALYWDESGKIKTK